VFLHVGLRLSHFWELALHLKSDENLLPLAAYSLPSNSKQNSNKSVFVVVSQHFHGYFRTEEYNINWTQEVSY
jgi:hypothetical protein